MNKLKLTLGVIIAFMLCMTISCTKEETTGGIQGTVTNASTSEPIQGVSITIDPSGMSAVTGSDGSYDFTDLEPGQYTLKAVKEGYEDYAKSLDVTAGKTAKCDIMLQPIGGTNNVVVSDGLFCYFDFENEELADWTGNFTGINSGTTVSTDTPSGEGQSRQFDGESYIKIEDNFLPAGIIFSINIWFKTGKTDMPLIGSDLYGGGNKESALWIMGNAKLRYAPNSYIYGWTTEENISQCLDNQWHMITLTYDGETATLYVDGTLFGSKTDVPEKMAWGNINNCYIGGDETANNTWYFQGKLDNFRSYSRALTEADIQALYQAKQ